MSRMVLPKQNGAHCKVCGHPHHDGALWLEMRDYNKQEPYFIKACDYCGCDKCVKDRMNRLTRKAK